MLRIDMASSQLTSLKSPSMGEADMTEKYHLQELIWNSGEAFFTRIDERLLLLGKELQPSSQVKDRIDILALDESGSAVIIELKRGFNKLQLLQAISYAAMVAEWQPEEMEGKLGKSKLKEAELFLDDPETEINKRQRILLIAEAFDISVLAATKWLTEKYRVDIKCIKIALFTEGSEKEEHTYLVPSVLYPTSGLEELASLRGPVKSALGEPGNWDDVLAKVENTDVRDFARDQITEGEGRKSLIRMREIRYQHNGLNAWGVRILRTRANVGQIKRFKGDIDFWRGRLSQPDSVHPAQGGLSLSFRLETGSDFQSFLAGIKDLIERNVVWESK